MKTNRGGWRMLRREQLMDTVRHDPYQAKVKPPEPTRCPGCGAVFQKGRWTWGTAPAGAHEELCPACRRIREKLPAGYVTLAGAFLAAHRDEILNRVRSVEAREKGEHPLERIVAVADQGAEVLVTTTSAHLARAIGEALEDAWKGELEYHYNDEDSMLRVRWARE
ncbi:MAG: BCAM0308 family protein [Burkholderiales bacterium]|nr:BCAM0308 family protein [Burkholderiales bacterium]